MKSYKTNLLRKALPNLLRKALPNLLRKALPNLLRKALPKKNTVLSIPKKVYSIQYTQKSILNKVFCNTFSKVWYLNNSLFHIYGKYLWKTNT
jgi:hypothetical protein